MLLTKGGGAGTWDGQASTAALAAKGAAMRCEPKGATAMLMADVTSIREVILFPLLKSKSSL